MNLIPQWYSKFFMVEAKWSQTVWIERLDVVQNQLIQPDQMIDSKFNKLKQAIQKNDQNYQS